MGILASFNYTEPSSGVVWAGVLGAAALLLLRGFAGNIPVGVLGGGLGTGVIAWFVLGAGRGDLTGLMQLFYAPLFGVVGGVLGGVAAGLGKALWQRRRSGHAKDAGKRALNEQ
jgi:hypothetical protein